MTGTFKDVRLIVTHPGAAHRDDLLSVAVVLGLSDKIPVERRIATDQDLEDTHVVVLDQGGRHDPQLRNFDHHQFPADAEVSCTLHLLLRHLSLLSAAERVWPWLEWTLVLDARGPQALARAMEEYLAHPGEPTKTENDERGRVRARDVLRRLSSPVETSLLRVLSRTSRIGHEDPLHILLADMGRDLLDELTKLPARLARFDREASWLDLRGVDVLALGGAPITALDVSALEVWLIDQSRSETAVLVLRDDRGDGWKLVRRNDHPQVDFRRIAGHPGVGFVHPTGFLAIVDAETRIHALLTQAIMGPQ